MNAYNVYRQTQTQTAAPGELVLMLYRGALRFLSSANEAIGKNDVLTAHTSLLKAQAVITELRDTLDFERGGDFARNLESIYVYMHRRLVEANVRKDVRPVHEVFDLLRELLSAWEVAVRQTSAAAPAELVGASR